MKKRNQKVIIIATVDMNRSICKNVFCEKDLFLKGNIVVMGRSMWFNLPQGKFNDTINYVLSENSSDLMAVASGGLKQLSIVMNKNPDKNVYIIGGSDIYSVYMNIADEIILTQMKKETASKLLFPEIHDRYGITECRCDIFSSDQNCFYDKIHYSQNTTNSLHPEYAYLDLCDDILTNGFLKNRTLSLPGKQLVFDITEHFPVMTTISTNWVEIFQKLVSCLSGNGDIGFQWRFFGAKYSKQFDSNLFEKKEILGGVDQISKLEETLFTNPLNKKMLLLSWNPIDKVDFSDICCQFYTDKFQDRTNLSVIVGVIDQNVLKINELLCFYALLVHVFAIRHDMTPSKLIINFGECYVNDTNLERNKLEALLNKVPNPFPKIYLDKIVKYKKLQDLNIHDFSLVGYFPKLKK